MSKIEIIPSPEKMPKVVEAAHIHPDVILAGGIEETMIATGQPTTGRGWQKTLNLYTCLREPTYDPDQLNQALRGIAPDIEPSRSDEFRILGKNGDRLALGKLHFDDMIGSLAIKRDVQIVPNLKSFAPGEIEDSWGQDTTIPLLTRTSLWLFPDAESLSRVFTKNEQDFCIWLPVRRGPEKHTDPLKDPTVLDALN